MKQVYLHFREFELGFLTQKDDVFVWVPNTESIRAFETKYTGASDMLLLDKNEPVVYEKIPYHFVDFVETYPRADLAKQCGITANDSDFDRLCKLATLDYFNMDFEIKI
jgi:hypothetical protein